MILKKSTYFSLIVIVLLILINAQSSFAQQTDSLKVESNEQVEAIDTSQTHSVATATWRSIMAPGWGQAYNKKYWKMPIIYAAMGTTIYFAVDNHQSYKRFLNAFYIRIDDDSTTTDDYVGLYDERQLIEIQDLYRKWRDLSLILTGFAYALQIIDAHVDGHLFYYDVSDDLSINWEPTVITTPNFSNAIGVSLKFNFP